jgi:hypothetical protein
MWLQQAADTNATSAANERWHDKLILKDPYVYRCWHKAIEVRLHAHAAAVHSTDKNWPPTSTTSGCATGRPTRKDTQMGSVVRLSMRQAASMLCTVRMLQVQQAPCTAAVLPQCFNAAVCHLLTCWVVKRVWTFDSASVLRWVVHIEVHCPFQGPVMSYEVVFTDMCRSPSDGTELGYHI